MRLMIDLGFRSRATPLEAAARQLGMKLVITSFYHSLLGLARGKMFWGRALYEWPTIRPERAVARRNGVHRD